MTNTLVVMNSSLGILTLVAWITPALLFGQQSSEIDSVTMSSQVQQLPLVDGNYHQNRKNERYQLYPNPFANSLYFSSSTFHDIRVYNLSGKLIVHIEKDAESIDIDMTGMPSGTYIVKLSDGNVSFSEQIIKR